MIFRWCLGDWNSVFRRFSRWSIKGVWWRIFEAMSDHPDFEYLIVDSTIVRAHQHAVGTKKGDLKIGRSAARAVARAPRYIWPFAAWDVLSGSGLPQVRRAMHRKPPH